MLDCYDIAIALALPGVWAHLQKYCVSDVIARYSAESAG